MYLDIHSHILHNMDDGAKDLETSFALLEEMYSQGISDVIATPHFYPLLDTLDNFLLKREKRFDELKASSGNKNIPNIYLGCEVLYYSGISNASSLEKLTLADSKYMLIEPDFGILNTQFQSELLKLKEAGFLPIIAHIERYYKTKGYKKFLNFAKENNIPLQVNATSFFSKHYTRTLKKLVKEDLITVIASDTHSLDIRPPMISDTLQKIEELYGTEYKQKLIKNSQNLLFEITQKESDI